MNVFASALQAQSKSLFNFYGSVPRATNGSAAQRWHAWFALGQLVPLLGGRFRCLDGIIQRSLGGFNGRAELGHGFESQVASQRRR
jgi:hypothetical protein